MPKHKSSLAQQIAELEVSVPKDFDPEEDVKYQSEEGSGEESSEDEGAGTEHYAAVGKSKLRKTEEVALGPKYAGSRVTREDLMNDDDEDEEEEDNSDSEDGEENGASAALNNLGLGGKDDEDEDEVDEDEEDQDVDTNSDSQDGEENGPFAELNDLGIGGEEDLDGDIDSDAAFGDSDDEKFKKFTFRGSGKPRETATKGPKQRAKASDFMSSSEDEESVHDDMSEQDETDEDILDVDAQHMDGVEDDEESDIDMDGGVPLGDDDDQSEDNSDQESENDSEDGSEEESEEGEDDKSRRDELRKLMGEEQQTVVAMSQAAKADAAKGNAVKAQRKAFDSLLHARMDLQKALIATNSMAAVEEKDSEDANNFPYEGAEEAAIKLWNTLDGLRHELLKANGAKSGQKRKRGIDSTTSTSIIWDRMQATEVAMIDNRQTTLDKWSTKVRGTDAQPISKKLNPAAPQQSLTSLLQDQLVNSDHLIQRTKIPRSCAPIQRDAKLVEDPNIYDDGFFYQLLLKELVDQRRVESLSNGGAGDVGNALQWTAVKEIKTRKNVDTKASKGRKMRYNIHEKIQNFMAPEDRGSWESDAIDRFFGTLLGQKMTLTEEDAREGGEEVSAEEEGLMLFRS